jgi:hypothetical protein
MQFVYGGYSHDVNSVAFTSVQRQYIDSPNGKHKIFRVNWGLKGKIIRPGQSQVFGVLSSLQNAYSIGGHSAAMLDNNGGPTLFTMDSPSSIGGVLITNPVSHEEISGAHGTTFLKYTFGLQADYFVDGTHNDTVLSFTETIAFSDIGGGPIQVERVPATGYPIIQNVTEHSFFHATQSGSLTQLGPNPFPMAPIWPNLLRGQDGASQVTLTSPQMTRGIATEYGIQWSYQFVSAHPIAGAPNVVP